MKKPKFLANPTVFFTSLLLIVSSLLFCIAFPKQIEGWMQTLQNSISSNFGWFFILTVNIILIFSLYLAFSKFGKIRLGGENAEPEFDNISWFAMLFSTGMGIGLMFFSIGEPVSHFANPPQPISSDLDSAVQAMNFTSLHYGLHVWAIYGIVGLALAFFGFNRKLPMTFRSLFYPFWGEKIHGVRGDIVDILSVLATIFGLATTLGFGVIQISTGIEYLYGWEMTPLLQSILILGVISVATISVFRGLDKGLKFLSNVNIYIAVALMLLIFGLGPSVFILKSYIGNTGSYLSNLVNMSTWTDNYLNTAWQNSWTVFYWAWWISWSPFVGTFIARISKGRSIKEFILGVLIVPTLFTLLWMNVFGSSALQIILDGDLTLVSAVQEDISSALFVFLEYFPLTKLLSVVAILLIFTFFITSSDSGSLVIDNITSGSIGKSPIWQRVFWSFMQGMIAIVLLWSGGLGALQTAVITLGLPFAVILLILCYSLYKGLKEEMHRYDKKLKSKEEKSYKDIITELIEDQQKEN